VSDGVIVQEEGKAPMLERLVETSMIGAVVGKTVDAVASAFAGDKVATKVSTAP